MSRIFLNRFVFHYSETTWTSGKLKQRSRAKKRKIVIPYEIEIAQIPISLLIWICIYHLERIHGATPLPFVLVYHGPRELCFATFWSGGRQLKSERKIHRCYSPPPFRRTPLVGTSHRKFVHHWFFTDKKKWSLSLLRNGISNFRLA